MFDGHYWSRVFRDVFAAHCSRFVEAIETRVLPAFDSLEREADEAADAEWDRLGNLPGDPDRDMSDLAEQATEAGVDYFMSMVGVRQSLLNISAAALSHMVDQQLLFFLRRAVLHPSEEDDPDLMDISILTDRLLAAGLDLRVMPTWETLQELRLVANTVKHAEGRSAAKLRKLRPELFVLPESREDSDEELVSAPHVYLPLAGEDVYVTMDDLRAYSEAVARFWEEFGSALL